MGETDGVCPVCGRSVVDETAGETEERELYSFGPLGVRICYSRPSLFKRTILNMTQIVLTDKRIIGLPKGTLYPTKLLPFKGLAQFQVSYETILTTELISFFFQKGVWIQYREEDKRKEVSILCSPVNSHHISKTYELLQSRASAR